MIIKTLEVIISVALIILILIQERSSGLSGTFGGGESGAYFKRRGFEKIIFYLTIISLAAFITLSILNFVL